MHRIDVEEARQPLAPGEAAKFDEAQHNAEQASKCGETSPSSPDCVATGDDAR
jgi:hypothetical protein